MLLWRTSICLGAELVARAKKFENKTDAFYTVDDRERLVDVERNVLSEGHVIKNVGS
jgi:hypothetical protein